MMFEVAQLASTASGVGGDASAASAAKREGGGGPGTYPVRNCACLRCSVRSNS